MDPIKEAFFNIKQDINFIKSELQRVSLELEQLKENNKCITSSVSINQSDKLTNKLPLEALKDQNYVFSIGNEGVPTNRQTLQQTTRQTFPLHKISSINEFERAKEIVNSLDEVKKSIRGKFKSLTNQEMAVFIELYALEEQNFSEITYKTLSGKLSLSESSIRDYINKLTKKGIPIRKTKVHNKIILLSVDQSLRNLVSLSTIIELRQL